LLFIVEYAAWFIGWNFALLYQLAALTVVVNWSKFVVNLAELVSNHNVTNRAVQAPFLWNEDALRFSVTGQAINLPAIAITIAITIFLVIDIRIAAIVNLVLVVIKIIILLIFIFACCKYVDRKNYIPFFPPNLGK
jgi:APA family basic amino acid/polyamine antiporter